jgi:hypothetical protein
MHDELSAQPDEAPLVTLDQNALIALRSHEPAASDVETLLALNRQGRITINVTLSTSMEAQRPGEEWTPDQTRDWLLSQGVARERIFTSSETVAFRVPDLPDVALFDPRLEIQFNQSIHAILSPNIDFYWQDYRAKNVKDLPLPQRQAIGELERSLYGMTRIPPYPMPAFDALGEQEQVQLRTLLETLNRNWFNAKNDSQGLYNHISASTHTRHPDKALFVTSDGNFFKAKRRAALQKLGLAGQILRPAEAVAVLA